MAEINRCPSCFSETITNGVCHSCGFDVSTFELSKNALPLGTILNNRYYVGIPLGIGGFGITYAAFDLKNGTKYAIKEYMPSEFAVRGSDGNIEAVSDDKQRLFEHCKHSFIEEAQTIKKLINNPTVVNIYSLFEENNTAYYSMELLEGENLRRKIKHNGGRLSPDDAMNILLVIGSALMEIHKAGIVHRDVTPENIYVCHDESIRLIDFGAARNFASSENKSLSILLKPGYAPPEQYSTSGNQGPWTDIYGLAATYYAAVTGMVPPDSMDRLSGGAKLETVDSLIPETPKCVSDAIEKALELDYKKRYKNVKLFFDDLKIPAAKAEPSKAVPIASQTEIKSGTTEKQESSKLQTLWGELRSLFSSKSNATHSTPMQNKIDTKPISETANKNVPKAPNYSAPKPPKDEIGVVDLSSGKLYMLNNGTITIGRSDNNTIVIADTKVSRLHCKITFDEKSNCYKIVDLSANGTYLNNIRMNNGVEYTVNHGTPFFILSEKYTFCVI